MKYYVAWGKHEFAVTATNPLKACIKAMNLVFREFKDVHNHDFRVSEQGFIARDTDKVFKTTDVIKQQHNSESDEPFSFEEFGK
jgi:hypothetical protein